MLALKNCPCSNVLQMVWDLIIMMTVCVDHDNSVIE